jgi:hypothetical protein
LIEFIFITNLSFLFPEGLMREIERIFVTLTPELKPSPLKLQTNMENTRLVAVLRSETPVKALSLITGS